MRPAFGRLTAPPHDTLTTCGFTSARCQLAKAVSGPTRRRPRPHLPDVGRPLLQNLTIVEVAVAGLGVTLAISPEATTSRLAGRTAVR